MIYKSFCGEKVSALGLGCMRLPQTEDKKIDEKALAEMVKAAFEGGVNYFDTAWGYHGGQSEGAVGRALAAYPRDSFFLATKFPGYDVANMDRAPEIFQTQLSRCGVEYFDFYLCHNVNETNIDLYLDPKFGIVPYLVEQKKQGRIRHLGFSAHGTVPTIRRFLEAYGEHMEFCQIQVNYLDWKIIQAEKKVALLKEWGLPVLAMEPVRGGKLIQLDETIAAPFAPCIPSGAWPSGPSALCRACLRWASPFPACQTWSS